MSKYELIWTYAYALHLYSHHTLDLIYHVYIDIPYKFTLLNVLTCILNTFDHG